MMKKRYVIILLLALHANLFAGATVEVDIHGMTCAFCVDAVQRNLNKLPDVDQVEVSLKNNRIRIQSNADSLDIERVKQTILDSGFTPTEVRALENE